MMKEKYSKDPNFANLDQIDHYLPGFFWLAANKHINTSAFLMLSDLISLA